MMNLPARLPGSLWFIFGAGMGLLALSLVPASPVVSVVRALLAVPFVLWVPGWALVAALFPHSDADPAERVLLVFGLSLGCGILGGLVLNLLPWGLGFGPWLGYYLLLVCASLFVAARRGLPVLSVGTLRRTAFAQVRIPVVVGIVLFAASVAITLFGARQQPTTAFTQLWALPQAGNVVDFGISNDEPTVVSYRLDVIADGEVVRSWPDITLSPSETWHMSETIQAPGAVDVRLYRNDQPATMYRQVQVRRTP